MQKLSVELIMLGKATVLEASAPARTGATRTGATRTGATRTGATRTGATMRTGATLSA